MLDLKRYTRICQLNDRIELLENAINSSNNSSYVAKLKQARQERDELLESMIIRDELKVNLRAYIRNCIKVLNRNLGTDEPRWQYYFEELEHNVIEQEHFYGSHTYNNYKYQVVLMQGTRKELLLCIVNRKLEYYNENEIIDLFYDKMYPPFSLRLDETCDEIDTETAKALKYVPFKTIQEQQLDQVVSERRLIQQRIAELTQQLQEKNQQFITANKQIQKIEDKIDKCFISK